MSHRTAADEHKDIALGAIEDAAAHLKAIVIDRASGWSEYNETYFRKLRAARNDLLAIRGRLSRGAYCDWDVGGAR